MEDLKEYKVVIKKALEFEAMGYTLLGMHPPSSGTVGMALVLLTIPFYPFSFLFVLHDFLSFSV